MKQIINTLRTLSQIIQPSSIGTRQFAIPKVILNGLLVMFCMGVCCSHSAAQDKSSAKQRTLYVPFDDLDILFDGSSQHVYLSRKEFDDLLEKAKTKPSVKAPRAYLYSSVAHDVTLSGELATIRTLLKIETMEEGLHAIPIPFAHVYLQAARTADGTNVPLGKNSNGQTVAFLAGKAVHELTFEFAGVVKLESAKQSFQFQLTPASLSSLSVKVNGNVELASGAAVVSREYDQANNQTLFQLVSSRKEMNLVMSVNNRKLQEKKSILAKSVFIHELTSNYEQIHARINVDILYGSTGEVRFQMPDDFQITEVACPEMSNWSVEAAGEKSELVVRLRDTTAKSFALNVAATTTSIEPDKWQLRSLKPIDFSGSVSVVGVVAEERFELQSIDAKGLFAIDNSQIQSSIPETVFKTTTGAPAIATVAAFYAPDSDFSLAANFATPPAKLKVTPTSILFLSDRSQKLIGQYQLAAQHEKVVSFDLRVPQGWRVTSMKGSDGKPISFQRNRTDDSTILNVPISGGIPAGSIRSIVFEAQNSSAEWTAKWDSIQIDYPRFDVVGSSFDKGAIAVAVEDDLVVRPRDTKSLETLLKEQKALFGLEGFNTSLTFEVIDNDYSAEIIVDRLKPQITATAYNFFRLMNQQIAVNYEVAFDIQSARARKIQFSLPLETPDEVSIRGIDGVSITQSDSTETAEARIWTVELAEPTLGEIRIAVEFLQPLGKEEVEDYVLPLISTESVGYQTTLVAFEGNPDFDVSLETDMRSIDVGEMGDAQFVPGSRLLGSYSATDRNAKLSIDVSRRNIHQLPTAIIQSATIRSLVAKNGQSQSIAEYTLLTKVPYIELKLPASAKLWAAQLDGVPTRPQVRNDSILISLPPDSNRQTRILSVLYEDRISKVGLTGEVKLAAPELLLAGSGSVSKNVVPQAELKWHISLPTGYTITSNDGTVFTTREERRALPFETVGKSLFGGIFTGWTYSSNKSSVSSRMQDSPASSDQRLFYMDQSESLDFAGGDRNDIPSDEAKTPDFADRKSDVRPDEDKSFKKKSEAKSEREAAGAEKESSKSSPKRSSGSKDDDESEREPVSGKLALKKWFNKGIAGLTVSDLSLEIGGEASTFELESLGADPSVSVTIVDQNRIQWLAFSYGGLVIAFGLFLCRFRWKLKLLYIMSIILVAAVIPMLGDWTQVLWGALENSLFACCFLICFYVVFGIVSSVVRFLFGDLARFFRWALGLSDSNVTTTGFFLVLCFLIQSFNSVSSVSAQDSKQEVKTPVKIPADAIIVPYDPNNPEKESDQIFVPYAKYMDLLKKADPDSVPDVKLPSEFGWTAADYQATLSGDELIVKGTLELECFADSKVSVPLHFEQAVLTQAVLDKKPAQLKVISPPAKKQAKGKGGANQPQLVLFAEGQGKKTLEIELRMNVKQQGGWKQVIGSLPYTPASRIELKLPESGSELNYRIGKQTVKFVSTAENDQASFPLANGGGINLSWRSKVATSKVDQNLSLNSTALFDVRNDGLHLVWNLDFLFRASKRSQFDLELPKDFSVVRVYGQNIRGWEIRKEPQANVLEVTLLSEADSSEKFTIELSNRKIDLAAATSFPMPAIVIPDAAIHSGQITVRKSDSLDLQTDTMIGISRIDISEARQVKPKSEPLFNPKVFQAFEFSRTPYSVAIRCRPRKRGLEVKTRSLVDIREKTCGLDSQINVTSARPVHELTMELPLDLTIQNIQVPASFRRAITRHEDHQLLKLFLATGLRGNFAVNVSGRLKDHENTGQIPLPRIRVREAVKLAGEVSAIAEPQLLVAPDSLVNCESVLLSTVSTWLNKRNRSLARVAIVHKTDDFSGALKVTRKKPVVSATSVTNVNVTLRSIEESVMVSFDIQDAGVDSLSFLIPRELKDARIKADLVREKKIEPIGPEADATQFRVTLQLQDFVIGEYRVLLEQDRGLSAEKIKAPIPAFGDGYSNVERFVTVQNSGFDELLVKDAEGLEKLDRRQKPFRDLRNLIGGADIRQGYVVVAKDTEPNLGYQTNPRQIVETVGASIGLSEIEMTVDRSGGYRAEQKLYLDNRTEPFLEIEMPANARLWTVIVAGDPVKPIAIEGNKSVVRIPLIKTADGDSDFLVELKYGGKVGRLENLARLKFPFTKTKNINVASSNVKLNLPEDFDFWWFDGTLGVSEERLIEQAKDNYETALFSKLRQQASNSKSELVRQRAAQNLSLFDNTLNNDGAVPAELQSPTAAEIQVDNRDRFNQVLQRQKLILFGNSGNISNSYGGNFGKSADAGAKPKTNETEFNEKWLGSNGLVNPKVLEQNTRNTRFNAPEFRGFRNKEITRGGFAGGGGMGGQQSAQGQQKAGMQAQQEFKRQVVDNLNVLQEQSKKARRGGNKKDAILRKYQSQLENSQRAGRAQSISNLYSERDSLESPNDPMAVPQFSPVPNSSPAQQKGASAPGQFANQSETNLASIQAGSLSINLNHRGQEFLFQATGGELELEVTVVSKSIQRRSINLFVLLGMVCVMGCLVWFFGSSRASQG